MSLKKERFIKGIILAPDSIALDGLEGEIKVDSATGKIQTTLKDGVNPSAAREIITSSQTQTLTNKTLDVDNNIVSNIETDNLKAGVLNTNTSLTGASDTQVPSALAAKTYIDTANTAQQNIIDDLVTLSGVASGAENLGTFTGTTIPDNSTNKQALQALETEVETKATSAALSTHTGASSDVHGVGVGNSVVGTGTSQALTNKTIDADLNTISNIEDADIKVGAAISRAKLASGTANRVVVNNGTGVQTDAAAITAARALISDANGIPTHSSVTSTTLEFLDATSSVQTQLNSKVNASGGTLTNGSIVTPIRSDVKQDTKANLTTYALTASNGQLVFATDTKEMFQVIDGLIKAVGGVGGAADVNALLIQTFDTAALTDFTQTGLSLTTTNPINGAQSAGLTHQAGVSPTNDQLFTQTLTVDRKFRGQAMQLSLSVRSTASQGNLTVSVRDVTNSAIILSSQQIQTSSNPFTANTNSNTTLSNISNADMALLFVGDAVSGSNIPTGAVITALGTNQVTISAAATATASAVSLRASALPTRRTFSFTIPASCASLSYTVTALPEANSPRSIIDDVVIELSSTALLETSVEVPNVTAWQGYTPTFQGFGTPSSIEFQWRQVGESVEVRGKATSGTTTAVEARISLPNGYTSGDTSTIPSIRIAGMVNFGGTGNYSNVLTEPSATYFTFGTQASGASAGLTKQNASAVFATGGTFSFFASVPVFGLSATSTKTIELTQSGLVKEADSMIQLSGGNGYGSTATTTRRFLTVNQSLGSNIQYIDSATLGGQFVAQVSGIYGISYSESSTVNTNNMTVDIRVNGVSVASDNQTYNTNSTATKRASTSWQGYLNAGDIVTGLVSSAAESNAQSVNFTITRQGSLKQVSVSSDQKITIPTSELRFEGASTRGSTATAIVRFDTMAKLRGDAFTVESDAVLGTRITMRKAGKLDVSSSLFLNAGIYLSLNQAVLTAVPVASEILNADQGSSDRAGASASVFVKVGDVIRVASEVNPTANAINNLNLSFQEQEIQVSVSNTLPQFSESDSSIRVDTANGYGSTGTRIRRFSNVRENIGSDIEYLDSATNGALFTVKSSGIYNITYYTNLTALANFGISKNASSLTSDITALPVSERIALATTGGANLTAEASFSGYLASGDLIRPHGDATASGIADRTTFTISKVGKPNVTGVNVTPFINVPQPDLSEIRFEGASTRGSTATAIVRFDSNTRLKGSGLAVTSDATNGTVITVLKAGRLSLNATIVLVNGRFSITRNQATLTSLTAIASEILSSAEAAGTIPVSTTAVVDVVVGDVIRVSSNVTPSSNAVNNFTATLTSSSDQILTAPETFSTDTANLQYAPSTTYTLTTLANAPVGTYITFTYAANTNTRTQTTTRPTQTDADMNVNGMLIYTRAYNAASTAAQPAIFAIQIGKGLKGTQLNLYKSAGKVTEGTLDWTQATVKYGMATRSYNEITGILTLDAAFDPTLASTLATFVYNDTTNQTSGYTVINASKNPALTGINALIPRIATLSDVKASGTNGGTATSGAYQTRTLNTLVDPTGIVTSLASNQFTLPAGEYYIEASAPAYQSNNHKIKIRNITDGVDALIGKVSYAGAADNAQTTSQLLGSISIASPKIFELQHRVASTKVNDGFGALSSFGDNEVYATVKITRVR